MKKLLTIMMMVVSTAAAAQMVLPLPTNVNGNLFYSQDSDNFAVSHTSVGTLIKDGFGARIGYSTFKAPTLSATSPFTQLTYEEVNNKYTLRGAIGVRTLSHATNINKVGSDLADKVIARSSGLSASDIADIRRDAPSWAAADINSFGRTNGAKDYFVGDIELRMKMSDSLDVGLSASTDIVDSVRSIQTGTTYLSVMGDIDYLINENLNLHLRLGNTHFSDNNNRLIAASKVTWTFLPEYGISAFIRTKNYTDSNAGSLNYFSPKTLAQQAVGLQVRKVYNQLVFTAGGEVGNEQAKFEDGSKASNPIHSWTLGVQTQPGKRYGTTYGVSLTKSHHSNSSGNSGSYNWTGLNAWIKIPF